MQAFKVDEIVTAFCDELDKDMMAQVMKID